jgi:hypothetical protein
MKQSVERYSVRLVARNEGIEYTDEHDVFRFNVAFADKAWSVFLPCSKGKYYETHELTDEERAVVLPRISRYLEGKKYFGLFGPSYPVTFNPEPTVSADVQEARRGAAEFWAQKKKLDQE